MSGETAVETTVQHFDELDYPEPRVDDEFDPAADETGFETRLREGRERAVAERAARCRAGLESVESRRRVYREVACRSRALPHGPFRVLCFLLDYADKDLDNAFASRATVALSLGLKLPTYDTYLARLRRSGWVRAHEFYRLADGTQSSSGIQFCVPPGMLTPDDKGWVGPDRFPRRKNVQRRARRGRAVSDSATNGGEE